MLDQHRRTEIIRIVNDARFERPFDKDARKCFNVVDEAYKEVKVSVFEGPHCDETARLFIDLEVTRNELAAELGEEIE
jgi:hypothetical protein